MPPRDITALAGHAPHQQAHQRDIPPLHQLIEPLASRSSLIRQIASDLKRRSLPSCSHKIEYSFLNLNLMVLAVPAGHFQYVGRTAEAKRQPTLG
jgi:hypothetical protein